MFCQLKVAHLQTMQAIDKIQSTFPIPEWVSEKCPTARYFEHKLKSSLLVQRHISGIKPNIKTEIEFYPE